MENLPKEKARLCIEENPHSIKHIKQIPMIGIRTKRGVFQRIEKLVKIDLLVRNTNNKLLSKSFFRIGEAYSTSLNKLFQDGE